MKNKILEGQIQITEIEIVKVQKNPSGSQSKNQKFNDFTEDEIFYYMPRLSTKLSVDLSYKKTFDLFEKYGKEKIKLYLKRINELFIDNLATLASFKRELDKNVLEESK